MKKLYTKLIEKFPFLTNVNLKYVLFLTFFIIWMLFFDSYSMLQHQKLNTEIDKLENSKAYYKEEIKKDKQEIKSYQSSTQIEKFAREKYYMKRKNEDIFIIENENETSEE